MHQLRRFQTLGTFALLMTILLFCPCHADTNAGISAQRAKIYNPKVLALTDELYQKRTKAYMVWLNSPWKDDDRAYASIRYQIDSQVQRGIAPPVILNQWLPAFNRDPTNMQTLFGTMYAYHLCDYGKYPTTESNVRDPYGSFMILWYRGYRFPQTYNFIRLAYVFESAEFPQEFLNQYEAVGDKLLKFKPDDNEVRFSKTHAMFSMNSHQNDVIGRELASYYHEDKPAQAKYAYFFDYIYEWSDALRTHSLAEATKSLDDLQNMINATTPGTWAYVNDTNFLTGKKQVLQKLASPQGNGGEYVR